MFGRRGFEAAAKHVAVESHEDMSGWIVHAETRKREGLLLCLRIDGGHPGPHGIGTHAEIAHANGLLAVAPDAHCFEHEPWAKTFGGGRLAPATAERKNPLLCSRIGILRVRRG